MNKEQIKELFSCHFFEDYSKKIAIKAVNTKQIPLVYMLAMDNRGIELGKSGRAKMVFRAAYVLERIFFDYPEEFELYKQRFIDDFPKTENESAKRHFAKMMWHLLDDVAVSDCQAEEIAEACLKWISEPKVRVAVQIWVFEVLIKLRERVEGLSDVLPEVLDLLRQNSTPAIRVRLREWKKICD